MVCVLWLAGVEVPQETDAYHSVRQSKTLFNALPFVISPANPPQLVSQTPGPSANSSSSLQAGSEGPSHAHEVPAQLAADAQQLFLGHLCDVCSSLQALTLQGLAPKERSKLVVDRCSGKAGGP